MPHIQKALLGVAGYDGFLPDGELYNHLYKNKFEELSHFIRQSEPIPGHEIVQYHIYDVNLLDVPYSERLWWLRNTFSEDRGFVEKLSPIKLVETIEVSDEDEMMEAFETFNKQGYEGAIVRNANGLYVEKRSVDLQKLKTFQDEEFKVVGVKEGRGKLEGHGLFICKLPPGKDYPKGDTFDAKMVGKIEDLKKYWENPKLVINRDLTVKFQGYTKYNKPRFPVAWRFAEKL